MNAIYPVKKPAGKTDWHKADIKCALEKKGWTLSRLAAKHGYSRASANAALAVPRPIWEAIIAEVIGVPPQSIWPSRYLPDGRSVRRPWGGRRKNASTPSHTGVISQNSGR